MKKNGDPTYLVQAAKRLNGELATKSGPKTMPNKGLSNLDKARVGSKNNK
jgi:hypothetical protein